MSTYSVKILNFFNPELQLKDSESAIKNKLIDLMSQLKVFKFVTALVIEFKKYKVMIKHYMQPFIDNAFESIYSIIVSNIKKYTYSNTEFRLNYGFSHRT